MPEPTTPPERGATPAAGSGDVTDARSSRASSAGSPTGLDDELTPRPSHYWRLRLGAALFFVGAVIVVAALILSRWGAAALPYLLLSIIVLGACANVIRACCDVANDPYISRAWTRLH